MSKNAVFLSAIFATALGFVACGGPQSGNNPALTKRGAGVDVRKAGVAAAQPDSAESKARIDGAFALLAKTTTGQSLIDEMQSLKDKGVLTGVRFSSAINPDDGHLGQIVRTISNDQKDTFDIAVKANVTKPEDVAHVIAHEFSHLKNQMSLDGKKIESQMADAVVVYFEMKAFALDLQLDKEGLTFNKSDIRSADLLEFVTTTFVKTKSKIDGLYSNDEQKKKFSGLIDSSSSAAEFIKTYSASLQAAPTK